jgi:hypothetical protein
MCTSRLYSLGRVVSKAVTLATVAGMDTTIGPSSTPKDPPDLSPNRWER